MASAPLGDASGPSPGRIGMFSGQLAQNMVTNFQRSRDTLYSLAKDTGGQLLFDDNDLSLGIRQAARSTSRRSPSRFLAANSRWPAGAARTAIDFYRGDVKAFETSPLIVASGFDAKTKAVPLRFSLPLTSLTPGRYDCQVTVIDPTAETIAFWRAPIVIVR